MSSSGHSPLRANRARVAEGSRFSGVIVDVDATENPQALAVMQASLHELPEGAQLGYGYDVGLSGLGAWVSDRKVRISIWPAIRLADGTIDVDDPSDEGSDVLVVDLDPATDREAIDALARLGRLVIAGPESGPVPLVVDLDVEVVAEAVSRLESL